MRTLIKEIEIKIGGKKYSEDYNFLNMTLEQELLRPNVFSFTLQKKAILDSVDDVDFPLPKKLMGEKVEFSVETTRFDEKDKKVEGETLTFKGIIFQVNMRRRSDLFSEHLFDVKACSADYLLIDHPHCFSYEEMTLKDIVSKTIEPYKGKLTNEINPRTTGSILYTVQYNESNYQFLTRLAQRYGEWMYNDGEKWFFGKLKKRDPVIKIEPRNDISNYQFQVVLLHHKLKHANHDYLKYDNQTKSDSDLSGLTNSGYHELTDAAKDKASSLFTKETFQHLRCSIPEENEMDELDVSMKAQLFGEKTHQVVLSGSTLRVDLTLGSVIELVDHFFDGDTDNNIKQYKYIITGITHSVEMDGNYTNRFTAYPEKSEFPPYYQSDNFPFASAQRALVKENDDPEKLGRIRVQFLWQEEQDSNMMTPWIRIAQPHGGDDKGFYFIPEKDEEVMVGFENGNAEKPYVVGTLYHGKQHPGKKWPTSSNDIKAIRTRNGHTIEIHDEGDDGYIRIYDHEKENYILTFSTDDKLIKLESTGNIELYAKEDIIMEAGNDMKIKVGNDKNVDVKNNMTVKVGADLKVKADSNIKEEAGSEFEQKAGSSMKLSSITHEQTASASMKLDGGGQLEAKAGIVKIN